MTEVIIVKYDMSNYVAVTYIENKTEWYTVGDRNKCAYALAINIYYNLDSLNLEKALFHAEYYKDAIDEEFYNILATTMRKIYNMKIFL